MLKTRVRDWIPGWALDRLEEPVYPYHDWLEEEEVCLTADVVIRREDGSVTFSRVESGPTSIARGQVGLVLDVLDAAGPLPISDLARQVETVPMHALLQMLQLLEKSNVIESRLTWSCRQQSVHGEESP